MKLLEELFNESAVRPITYDNKVVVRSIQIPIKGPCRFTAHVVKSDPNIKQGLTLGVEPGKIEFGGATHKSVICWYDQEPWIMEANLMPKGEESKLFVWNSWANFGRTDAWSGNAGMVVKEPDADSDCWVARCSAGAGPVNFDDFVFTFELGPI